MAWNGSGVFARLYSWVADRDNSVNIDATRTDAEMANYKAGLENCMTLTGETTPVASISMGSQRITSLAAGTASTDAVNKAQAEAMAIGGASTYAVDSGSANAVVLTPTPAVTAYAAGQKFMFLAAATNTGATTVNVSGLGTKSLKTYDGSALAAGQVTSNALVLIGYDGTDFRLLSYTSSPGIDDNATGEIIDITDTGFSATASDGTLNWIGRRLLLTSTSTGTTAGLEVVDQDAAADRASIHIKANAGATEVLWGGSTGLVGIGTAAPAAKLHVKTAASSATPGGDLDEFVIENSGSTGMSILAGTTGTAAIAFGDSGDADIGKIAYDHSADTMGITAGATDVVSVASTGVTIASTDAGASVAPNLILDRNSASPAASDSLGALILRGRDAAGNTQTYGQVKGVIKDTTDGSEDGAVVIGTPGAGSMDDRLTVQLGAFIGAPTGFDKGTGTLNVATAYYVNGSIIAGLRPGTVYSATYATSSAGTSAHGLGAAPHILIAHLVCTTTNAGYSAGDIVKLEGNDDRYITIFADATNVGWATDAEVITLVQKTGTTEVNLTAANWNIVIRSFIVV